MADLYYGTLMDYLGYLNDRKDVKFKPIGEENNEQR